MSTKKITVKSLDCRCYMDSSRPKTNFNLRLVSTNVMLRFKLDVNFVHSLKFHFRGFSAQNAHMVHIVNEIRYKMVYTS